MLNFENPCARLSLCVLLALPTSSTFSAERNLFFPSSTEENICIVEEGKPTPEKCKLVTSLKSFDNKSKKIFDENTEIFPIFFQSLNDGKYLVLISRAPSKLPQSTGYCGAGYEDLLVLLKYQYKRVRFLDKFLLQSCLKNISLKSDNPDDILKTITVDMNTQSIQFQWLSDLEERNHIITISDDKFLLH